MVNYAAIDFGSNSTRILIASVENKIIEKKLKTHIVTRMAEGLLTSNSISSDAIKRVHDAMEIFEKELNSFEIESIFAIGTSAMRDSNNALNVIEMIRNNFNINIEVISGEKEARLTHLGALHELDQSSSSILFDIGGGSTEVIFSKDNRIIPFSYQIGVVRMTEEVLHSRPVDDIQEKAAVEIIKSRIHREEQADFLSDEVVAIGTAGTFTSLGAISLGLTSYDSNKVHMHKLNKSWLSELYSKLRQLDVEGIINEYPGIDPARSTTITPGALIARELMEIYEINNLVVSENDILEGLILNKVLN